MVSQKLIPYLIVIGAFLLVTPIFPRDKILPPDKNLIPILPVPTRENDMIKNIKKRRQERIIRNQQKHRSFLPQLKSELEKHGKEKKPMLLQMVVTPVITHAIVTGDEREEYQTDPTLLFHLKFRPFSGPLKNDINFWTGLRLAPFSGNGIYKGISAAFSFLYVGPMFGIGKFSLARVPNSEKNSKEIIDGSKKTTREVSPYQKTSFFLSGGIALQSRLVRRESGRPPPDEEFDTRDLVYDSPGLWAEYIFSVLHYNTISVDYTVGLQSGKKKLFAYLGVGVGLWH